MAFLTTLATKSIFSGVNFGITGGNPFYNLPEGFRNISLKTVAGIPVLLLLMLVVLIIFGLMIKFTYLGKQILAVGGNIKAAELSGISVKKIIILSFAISGLLSATAAVLLVSRIKSAQPDVGSDWLLYSFAVPLIGGTRLDGGKVDVFGALIGAVIIAVIQSGLVYLNIDVYWMSFVQGIIILAVVAIDRLRTVGAQKMESEKDV